MRRGIFATLVVVVGAIAAFAAVPYPEPQRFELLLKAGYSKDEQDSAAFPLLAAGAEYRTRPVDFSAWGGGYWLLRFPARLYRFPTQAGGSWLTEVRVRPEVGPPLATWIPNGFMDIGYHYADHDWLTARPQHTLHALSIGGWFSLPLLAPRRGTFLVSGSRTIYGSQLTRFSCYLDWMIGSHWGLTLHGDNFTRRYQDEYRHYGSFNGGVIWRW